MKKAYIMLSIVVLVLFVSSYFLHFSDDSSDSIKSANSNFLTGRATENFDYSYYVAGNIDGCFVYNSSCPSGTNALFKVDNDFFSVGGGHVGEVGNNYFPYRVCCNDILVYGGDRTFYLFSTGYTIGESDVGKDYGAHVYPAELGNGGSYVNLSTKVGNYLQYIKGDCPPGWNCIVKVSSLDNYGYDFYNSHVWNYSQTFPNFNLTSICYKPEKQTDCTSYEGECQWEGWDYVKVDIGPPPQYGWVYCSFGEDDIQTPVYPSSDYEIGHCCLPGEYYHNDLIGCIEAADCGFDLDHPDFCFLSDQNPNGSPLNLYLENYFSQPGCVDWVNDVSCCWNVSKYGSSGNYYCDIITTSI